MRSTAACITVQMDTARSRVLTLKRSPPTDSRSAMVCAILQLGAFPAYVPVALVVFYRIITDPTPVTRDEIEAPPHRTGV